MSKKSKSWGEGFIRELFIIIVVAFAAVTAAFYVFQDKLIYIPNTHKPSYLTYNAEDMQDISLKTADGLSLYAWYKPATNHLPTILYFHGNAGDIGTRMGLARSFLDQGFGFLLLEYRGYGGNKGRPSEEGFYLDARAGIHFLEKQGVLLSNIVLYGESLGSAVATKIATEYQVCALVLQSPFTSLSDVARHHYPFILIKPRDKFDSASRMASIFTPLLITHGDKDEVVPYEQGLMLYQSANQPKALYVLPSKGHGNLWQDPAYVPNVVKFIQKYCQPPAPDPLL